MYVHLLESEYFAPSMGNDDLGMTWLSKLDRCLLFFQLFWIELRVLDSELDYCFNKCGLNNAINVPSLALQIVNTFFDLREVSSMHL